MSDQSELHAENAALLMSKTVARLNIAHFYTLLAKVTDETKRQMLVRLLAEEEAKLAGLLVVPGLGPRNLS